MKRVLFFLIISSTLAFGKGEAEADTFSNIISYKSAWQLKSLIRGKFSDLTITNYNYDPIIWRSNNRSSLGFGVYHKWIGITAFFDVGLINQDETKYGKTESFNFTFNMYPRNWAIEVYTIIDQGFYLENPENWQKKASPYQPATVNSNMAVASAGLDVEYYFNGKNYSIRAPFVMFERLKKSAGSFLLGGYLNISLFDTDSVSLIPFVPDINDEKINQSNINSAFYTNLGVLGGYSHMFILDEYYFFSATAGLGINIQNSSITAFDNQYNAESDQRLNTKIKFKAAFGYNSEKYFFSLGLQSDNFNLNRGMSYNYGLVTLQGGLRFWTKKKA